MPAPGKRPRQPKALPKRQKAKQSGLPGGMQGIASTEGRKWAEKIARARKDPSLRTEIRAEMKRELDSLQFKIDRLELEIKKLEEKERVEQPRAVSSKGFKPHHVLRLAKKGFSVEAIAGQTGFTGAEVREIRRKNLFGTSRPEKPPMPSRQASKLRIQQNALRIRQTAITSYIAQLDRLQYSKGQYPLLRSSQSASIPRKRGKNRLRRFNDN